MYFLYRGLLKIHIDLCEHRHRDLVELAVAFNVSHMGLYVALVAVEAWHITNDAGTLVVLHHLQEAIAAILAWFAHHGEVVEGSLRNHLLLNIQGPFNRPLLNEAIVAETIRIAFRGVSQMLLLSEEDLANVAHILVAREGVKDTLFSIGAEGLRVGGWLSEGGNILLRDYLELCFGSERGSLLHSVVTMQELAHVLTLNFAHHLEVGRNLTKIRLRLKRVKLVKFGESSLSVNLIFGLNLLFLLLCHAYIVAKRKESVPKDIIQLLVHHITTAWS